MAAAGGRKEGKKAFVTSYVIVSGKIRRRVHREKCPRWAYYAGRRRRRSMGVTAVARKNIRTVVNDVSGETEKGVKELRGSDSFCILALRRQVSTCAAWSSVRGGASERD